MAKYRSNSPAETEALGEKLAKTVKGGIGIGDDASVLNPIKNKLYSTKIRKDGVTEYRYYLNPDWDYSFYVCVKDNRIVDIYAVARTL